jgi:hypothetical protein
MWIMKQQISPILAAIIIVVVLGIAVFAYIRFGGGAGSKEGEKPPGMPADVAAEFQKRMGGVTGPPPSSGPPMPR